MLHLGRRFQQTLMDVNENCDVLVRLCGLEMLTQSVKQALQKETGFCVVGQHGSKSNGASYFDVSLQSACDPKVHGVISQERQVSCKLSCLKRKDHVVRYTHRHIACIQVEYDSRQSRNFVHLKYLVRHAPLFESFSRDCQQIGELSDLSSPLMPKGDRLTERQEDDAEEDSPH